MAATSRGARQGALEMQKWKCIIFFLPKQKHPLPVLSAYWDHKEITISSLILQISQAERMAGRHCSSNKITNQRSVSRDQLEFKTPACFWSAVLVKKNISFTCRLEGWLRASKIQTQKHQGSIPMSAPQHKLHITEPVWGLWSLMYTSTCCKDCTGGSTAEPSFWP